jgi:hypothetical protein
MYPNGPTPKNENFSANVASKILSAFNNFIQKHVSLRPREIQQTPAPKCSKVSFVLEPQRALV